jgi:predicted alpha/beta hydrolase family esterase
MDLRKEVENVAAPGSELAFTVLVLPGLNSSGPRHWQSLWEQGDARFRRVQQKDWLTPRLSDWVEGISQAVAGAEPPILFAAHSLGSIALAHWAQTAGPELLSRVKGALLAAPADVDRPEVPEALKNFAPVPRSVLPFASVVVASSDDPHAPIARAREFAASWGSRFVDIGPADHIATNMGEWPEGKRLLLDLI